jgi:16S rRNA (guanine1207-N2)-methyltransferase
MDAELTPAQDLLADLAADLDDIAVILVPGGSAAFVDELAALHPGATIHWLPIDARELPAPADVVVHDDIADPAIAERSIDLVAIEAPGDRDLARRWLALARRAARASGVVLVAGANDAGIRSAIGDARDAIGLSVVEDYRRRNRVAHIAVPPVPPPAPEWLAEPGIEPGTWARFTVEEGGIDLVFETLPGVFSADGLDEGTRLLLEQLKVPAGASVLDVGCGAGAIGVVAGRRDAGSVTMTDVNLLAVAAARRNASLAGAEVEVEVVASDAFGGVEGRRFDLIVSNPPFHQGKMVDYDMPQRLIAEAGEHLMAGGRLVIVANAFLPYDRLMRERFGAVEVLAATRQFRVLAASA